MLLSRFRVPNTYLYHVQALVKLTFLCAPRRNQILPIPLGAVRDFQSSLAKKITDAHTVIRLSRVEQRKYIYKLSTQNQFHDLKTVRQGEVTSENHPTFLHMCRRNIRVCQRSARDLHRRASKINETNFNSLAEQ